MFLDEQERLPAPFHYDARHVLAGIVKDQALPRAPVRAEGVEPSLTDSESAVLPLDEARIRVGLERIELITYRVRTGCSTFELQTLMWIRWASNPQPSG